MTVHEIVKEWLKAHGYQGLAGEDCGCALDDLMPCEGDWRECQPAYRIECSEDECQGCELSCPGYRVGRTRFDTRKPVPDNLSASGGKDSATPEEGTQDG